MFSIVKQFQASNALDEKNPGRTLPQNERGEFAQLDNQLRSIGPAKPTSADLHQSIMKAVRAGSTTDTPAKSSRTWAWSGPSLALGTACIALVVWFGSNGANTRPTSGASAPPPQSSMTAASTALALGGSLTSTFPAAITAPITDEWEHLNQDIAATTRTLLATLP